MQSDNTLRRHAALVDNMASKLGVDLEETALRGGLSIPDIEDAVLRCTGCTQPDTCRQWLAQQTTPQASPPDYCRNADLFADLQART